MSERNYRKYDQEFKKGALALLQRGDKSAGQIERELGITPGLLVKWRARYQIIAKEGQEAEIRPSDIGAANAEIRRLRRVAANLEEENEILKKALGIFSRTSE